MKFLPSLASSIVCLLAPALPARAAAPSAPSTRPNIIFLLTDDQRDNTLADLRARVATHSAALNQRRTDFTRLLPPELRRPAPPAKKAAKGD